MIARRVGRAIAGLALLPAIAFALSDNVSLQANLRTYSARSVTSNVARLPASSVTYALDRAITDSLNVVLASYVNAGGPGHVTTSQDVTVNQSTGSILFCGKIDVQGAPAGYIVQLSSSGTPIAAAAFTYQGGHAPVCSGIATDETTGRVYVAVTDIDDTTTMTRGIIDAYDPDGAGGFNQNPNGAALIGDPNHPGNNAAGGAAVDQATERSFFTFTLHTADPGSPPVLEGDYVGVISLNAAFDTAIYNFIYPIQDTNGGGGLGIAARTDGTNVVAIAGYLIENGTRQVMGAVIGPDGSNGSAFFSEAPDPTCSPQPTCGPDQMTKVQWNADVLPGASMVTKFLLTGQKYTSVQGGPVSEYVTNIRLSCTWTTNAAECVAPDTQCCRENANPFDWFTVYTATARTPGDHRGGGGVAFRTPGATGGDFYMGGASRPLGVTSGPYYNLVSRLADDGSRPEILLMNSSGSGDDINNSLCYNAATDRISAVGDTMNPGWSTDGTVFQGPQDSYLVNLGL
jgi:hypothetical protein